MRKAVRRHNQGEYRHEGQPPETEETIFGSSNPPPHVKESWEKIKAKNGSATVEDDWNYFGFLRWHVDKPNDDFMGL